ncbi:cation transporter [Klebsiella pneumoniae]
MEFIFIIAIYCTCYGCIKKVKGLRWSIQGVKSITIDENRGIATISGTVDPHTFLKKFDKVTKKTGRLLEESCPKKHQAGLDESTRKRTPNCCLKSGHKLELKPKNRRFTCIGCKEEGIGPRYRCDPCDYDFHKECKSPKETTTHELFKGSTFKYLSQPDKNKRYCDACGWKIKGCFYHCEAGDLDMHPCCSNLKGKLCTGGTDFILRDKVKYMCLWCKKKKRDWIAENEFPGWSYVSKEKRICCHVHCMWPMIFEAWKQDGFHGTDDDDDNLTMALSKIALKGMAYSYGNGGRCRVEILKSAGIFLRVIIGILLGDPTALGLFLWN